MNLSRKTLGFRVAAAVVVAYTISWVATAQLGAPRIAAAVQAQHLSVAKLVAGKVEATAPFPFVINIKYAFEWRADPAGQVSSASGSSRHFWCFGAQRELSHTEGP